MERAFVASTKVISSMCRVGWEESNRLAALKQRRAREVSTAPSGQGSTPGPNCTVQPTRGRAAGGTPASGSPQGTFKKRVGKILKMCRIRCNFICTARSSGDPPLDSEWFWSLHCSIGALKSTWFNCTAMWESPCFLTVHIFRTLQL